MFVLVVLSIMSYDGDYTDFPFCDNHLDSPPREIYIYVDTVETVLPFTTLPETILSSTPPPAVVSNRVEKKKSSK